MTTIERYKADLDRLGETGYQLLLAMQHALVPDFSKKVELSPDQISKLPNFHNKYEAWYSEALSCIGQLLPERVDDFVAYYKPKAVRKELTSLNYTISDYLRGISVTRGYDYNKTIVVDGTAAIQPMAQQYNIVVGLRKRFDSSLYDIRTLLHADLLDSELEAADELLAKGFGRAAGAVSGVVLEGHLQSVADRHKLKLTKKNPTISDLNDSLKSADVIDVAQWRFIQHLGDLRNKCDHKKSVDPTKPEIEELIAGVRKVVKTIL